MLIINNSFFLKVETEDFDATKSEWNLLQTSAEVESKTYPCCPDEPYEAYIFKFTIQRRSPSARFTVLIPTIGILNFCKHSLKFLTIFT